MTRKFLDRYGRGILKYALIFGLFALSCYRGLDPDFGWHLRAGDYIRQHWIPQHDLFTYTAPNFPWINHEWGSDVILSWLYSLGGYGLLSIIYGFLWSAGLMMNNLKVRVLWLMLAVSAMLPYAGIRQIAWSVLFFALLLRMVNSQSKYVHWLIVPLVLVWANLHGGFIVALGLLAYLAVRQKKISWLYILFWSVLASFINPYGPRLYIEVGRTLFDSSIHAQISEWHLFFLPPMTISFVALWAASFWLYRRRQLGNWWQLNTLLFLASLSASRNTPLFIIASTSDLDEYFEHFKKDLGSGLHKTKKILGVIAFVLIIGWLIFLNRGEFERSNGRETNYPAQAVSYLQKYPCAGNLYNSYDYGGYLIWKLPSEKVYIDGRMPAWSNAAGQRYMDIYLNIESDKKVQNDQFNTYNIRCVLAENAKNPKLIQRLEKQHWQPVVTADGATLLLQR